MRISAKSDYAVRALAELATHDHDDPVKAEDLALAQDIPLKFLLSILPELKQERLVRSHRGREGGYALARPPHEITLADVIRAVDGPLANIRDQSLNELEYAGAAAELRDVWMAVRGSLRQVLERVTLEQLASGELPAHVKKLALKYREDTARRYAQD